MSKSEYPVYRWFVLVAVVIATLAQGMILIAPTPLVGIISGSLNINLGMATAALMMPFTLMVAIGGIVGGIVVDKIGVGKTFFICSLEVAISTLIMPLAGSNLGVIILLRALQGLGCGPVIASGPRIAAEWFPKSQRGMFQGIQGAALSLGITIGLMNSPLIAAKSDWHNGIATFGYVMGVAFVLFIIYIATSKSRQPVLNLTHELENIVNMKRVFSMRVFWLGVAGCFALSWVMQGYNDLTPGHIAVPPPVGLGLGEQTAGQLMGFLSLSFMMGSLCSGFISEKIFKRSYKTMAFISFMLTAVFCTLVLVPGVNSNQSILAGCLILAGFFMGMPNPTIMTYIANNYPAEFTGHVGGITMGISIFGGTIAVAVGSFALHATGMYTASILIVTVICIIGALVSLGLKKIEDF